MIQIIPGLININHNLSKISLELSKLNNKSFFDSNVFSAIIGFASAIFVLLLDKLFLNFQYNKNKDKTIFIKYIKKLQLKNVCYFIKKQDFSCNVPYEEITKLMNLVYYTDQFDISFLKDKKLKKMTSNLINDLTKFEDLFVSYSENIGNSYKISSENESIKRERISLLNEKRTIIFKNYKEIEKYFFKKY